MGSKQAILTGLIIGGIYGWSFGWLLFDPDSLLWIPNTIIGLIIGCVVSRSLMFEILISPLCASAIGLFIGVLFVTWLYGDHIDGVGAVMAAAGAILGWKVGDSSTIKDSKIALSILLGTIRIGFGISLLFLVFLSIFAASYINLSSVTIIFIAFSIIGGLIGKWYPPN